MAEISGVSVEKAAPLDLGLNTLKVGTIDFKKDFGVRIARTEGKRGTLGVSGAMSVSDGVFIVVAADSSKAVNFTSNVMARSSSRIDSDSVKLFENPLRPFKIDGDKSRQASIWSAQEAQPLGGQVPGAQALADFRLGPPLPTSSQD